MRRGESEGGKMDGASCAGRREVERKTNWEKRK